ncbi:MAG: magnesium/cobalt transporter CorA, partial [Candidatus Nanohaloarchaea archaeon]|nr:magnesium/cobalt transporter CorA [Candidatus Nanohaloarchaea archaeon]
VMDDEEPLAKFLKDRSEKLGQSPGSLVHVGDRKEDEVEITVIDYGPDHAEEREAETVQEAFEAVDRDSVTWINVDGLHDEAVIGAIGERLGLHPLIQEDVLNTDQRPKLEDLDDHLFLVLKMLSYDDGVNAEQVSILIGENVVVSFQEQAGDVFDPVRERIRSGKGQLRKKGADYLAYALLDAVVDNYFLVLEELSDRLESIEDDLVEEPERKTLQQVQEMKRELVFVRKSVWPLRESISRLERTESDLIEESTRIYLRDVYEHTVQVIDIVESFRDVLSGTLDAYMSSISNRMNEVMKVLTIIGTIFIPLTFVAGIYGMNFEY